MHLSYEHMQCTRYCTKVTKLWHITNMTCCGHNDVMTQNSQNWQQLQCNSKDMMQTMWHMIMTWHKWWRKHLWAGFVQTLKHCFPGLSRTCKDQIPVFSRTQKNAFSRTFQNTLRSQTWLHEVKKFTYQISFRCNCITLSKPKDNNCGCINVFQWT